MRFHADINWHVTGVVKNFAVLNKIGLPFIQFIFYLLYFCAAVTFANAAGIVNSKKLCRCMFMYVCIDRSHLHSMADRRKRGAISLCI